MGGRPSWIALLVLGSSAPWAAPGRAQSPECGGFEGAPSELHVTPADRAEDVAQDALIHVRYPEGTDLAELQRTVAAAGSSDVCGGQVLCLFRDTSASGGSARRPEPGRVVQLDERTLGLVRQLPLLPVSDYFLSIARPGFARASRTESEFATGDWLDEEPPDLVAMTGALRLTIDEPPSECKAEPGSVRVRVLVPRIADDADETSVEALLFLTRAEGLRGPSLRARAHNPAQGDVMLAFVLTPEEAEEPVCIALTAIDGAGKIAQEQPELCFDPVQGSHFVSGCSAAAPRQGSAQGARTLILSSALILAAWLGLRRRKGGADDRAGTPA